MKRFSMWGYEISCCQECGKAPSGSPCRECREKRDRATELEAPTLWGGLDRELE